MGYRILTDQVLGPFGYNKTPTWIEYKWIEVKYIKHKGDEKRKRINITGWRRVTRRGGQASEKIRTLTDGAGRPQAN